MATNPFHDLHLKQSHNRHIRLISEGGTTLARSPSPVCIDTIQVAQACTSESHHALYRRTTGACSMFAVPDNSLFSVPGGHARELDDGCIPGVLRSRLAQRGILLSDGVALAVVRQGAIWSIADQGRQFSVRRLAARLTVFADPP